jgi:hypothetical protein
MDKERNITYSNLVEKHFGKLRLGSPRMWHKYNVKTGIRQIVCDDRKLMNYLRMV